MTQIERFGDLSQLVGGRVHPMYENASGSRSAVPRDGAPGISMRCKELRCMVGPVKGGYLTLCFDRGNLGGSSRGVDTNDAVLAPSASSDEMRLPGAPRECLVVLRSA
jgi:hypothetical protein